MSSRESRAVSRGSARRRRWSKEKEPPNMSDLRIVLLGKSVSENSGVGNFILGRAAFDSEAPPDVVERVGGRLKDRQIIIINSPQLLNTHLSLRQITKTVRECVYLSDPGPHVIVLLLKHDQCSAEDQECVEKVLDSFSEQVYQHAMVLTTQEPTQTNDILQKIIQICCNRHFSLQGNGSPDDLLQMFEDIVQMNDGRHLDCADGSQYFSMKQQAKRLSENISEKQKLNLVLCGSDGSLTVSVSKLLQGETFNPSHQKANSEECVKREEMIHDRVISLVELPAVNHLSEQEVMRQTLRCVSLCDPGVHVFLFIVPVGPLTDEDEAEIEKIQKIFDSREHFMALFISDISVEDPVTEFVKSSTDSQSLISLCGGQYRVMGLKESENSRQIPDLLDYIEKMKTKPYSVQMYVKAQENRVRRETEEKYKAELKIMENENKKLQERIQSDGAEGESDDLERLRIVLIGRGGSGKSATGNTILGRNEFVSESCTDSVTTVCEKGVGEVDGRSVAVVDTPGLFDTTLTNQLAMEEIMKCVSLSSPGPHVFIIVLSLGRFTKEDAETVDLIKKIFGHKAAQFSIVLFTRGDDLEDESIEDYVKRSRSAELMKLIRDCGNRFLAFNNREKQDKTQVTRLLNMIEEVKNTNEGRYFTNSMFEEAEMSIKKRMEEIIKEREREMENQREELQTKYEMDMKIMMKRLEEEKQRADEERKKMQNQFREKEEKLKREFEEKEKAEQKKRETENQKRSEEEKQRKAEYHQNIEDVKREIENQRLQYEKQRSAKYHQRVEEMKREIENQRSQYEKQQKEREEEDKKREEKYRQDQEKMKHEQEQIIAELKMKQEEETKNRDLEEKRRRKEEEEERQRWERKIKEAENDRKETQEDIKRQQREWEDEKKRQMREREEEERKKKEKHEEQLIEKLEEQEKMRKRFETEREEERQKIEEEREKLRREREEKEKEYEERRQETIKHYEQLEKQRKEEWERRRREDDERREEERTRWVEIIEDLKREQEEENKRRETERKEREEKERDEMKKKHKEEIQAMKKKHEDEARKQAEETNDLKGIKEELQNKLEEHQKQQEILEKIYQLMGLQKGAIKRIYEFMKGGTKVEDLHRRLQDMEGDELKKLQEEVEELWKESNKSKCVIM